jgi:hypothetical protein
VRADEGEVRAIAAERAGTEVEPEALFGEQQQFEPGDGGARVERSHPGVEAGKKRVEGCGKPRVRHPFGQGFGDQQRHPGEGSRAIGREDGVGAERQRLDLGAGKLAFSPGAERQRHAAARLHQCPAPAAARAGHEPGLEAVREGEEAHDRTMFAMGQRGQHQGVVGDFHPQPGSSRLKRSPSSS